MIAVSIFISNYLVLENVPYQIRRFLKQHKILLNNATYQYFQILMIDVHFLAKSQCQLTLYARIYKEGSTERALYYVNLIRAC